MAAAVGGGASSSPFPQGPQSWRYDVFLSFCGQDTGKNFTDHLYHGLRDAGVNAFRSGNDLPSEEEDTAAQRTLTIRGSRISAIVFSRNYADSRWRLQELAEIMLCWRKLGHMVLPIFYHVDPSDVRNHRGSFGKALLEHEKQFMSVEGKDDLARWRTALREAASLSGWHLKGLGAVKEAKIVRNIVRTIWNELKNTHMYVSKHPVGLDIRLEKIVEHLKIGLSDVRVVGICGMGGIGKTTLAKVVYNQLFHAFEAKSFLANVRERSEHPNGLVSLQKQLLSDVLKLEDVKVDNVHRGLNIIEQRLCSRRVLVVLDDLSHQDQLKTLARDREWFGSGSRVIITTRDVDLLKEINVDHIYMSNELSEYESLELLSHHAFGRPHPQEEFTELSKAVVGYCQGLPLALEVIGSFLLGRNMEEWRSAVEKLKKIPHYDVQRQLEVSFDALDDSEKDIFLDIACFFAGQKKDYAVKILNGCGLFATIGMSVLTERCLVNVSLEGELEMHDLLRDMGREIVRKESPKDPGKRSRLWDANDILRTLQNQWGTNKVEGIVLNLLGVNELKISADAFTNMRQLRLLQLSNVYVHGDYELLSSELRWLCWHNFPLRFVPDEFHLENLVAIDLQYSSLTASWKSTKFLGNLKVLNLSHSHFLTKTPDFSTIPSIEELNLEDCIALKEVHQSIGDLKELVLLNLKDCKILPCIPTSICRVKSLKFLNICGCSKINKLPDNIGEMDSLSEFLADGTSIKQVPPCIVQLKNLTKLSLSGCKKSRAASISSPWSWISPTEVPQGNDHLISSLSGLNLLKSLSLMDCNLTDDAITPVGIENLQSLETLNLGKNNFHYLPGAISCLLKLRHIILDECTELKSLADLPPSLYMLEAANCTSLERVSIENSCGTLVLYLTNCTILEEVSGFDDWNSDGVMQLDGCRNLSNNFKEFLFKNWGENGFSDLLLPGDIPEWFDYQSKGPSLSFRMTNCENCQLKSGTLCLVYASDNLPHDITSFSSYPTLTVSSGEESVVFSFHIWKNSLVHHDNHMFGFQFSLEESREQLDYYKDVGFEVAVDSDSSWAVKSIGVHFRREMCQFCQLSSSFGTAVGMDETVNDDQDAEVNMKRSIDEVDAEEHQQLMKRMLL